MIDKTFTVPGIYAIVNTVNGHRYVGSSVNIRFRLQEHVRALKNGTHNKRLQNAWNKYGENAFQFVILEQCERNRKIMLEREQFYIDEQSEYNLSKIAAFCDWTGRKHSESTKAKLSCAHKGKILSETHKRQIGESGRGKKRPLETGRRISQKLKGRSLSEENKRHLSESLTGRKLSEEQKQKIRDAATRKREERRMWMEQHPGEKPPPIQRRVAPAWNKGKRKDENV